MRKFLNYEDRLIHLQIEIKLDLNSPFTAYWP